MGVMQYLYDGAFRAQSIQALVPSFSSTRKTLSLLQVTAFGMCATLGAGIFVVCGSAGLEAGPSLLIAFILSAIGASLNAVMFAELGTAIPSSGSTFSFVYVSMGELPAVFTAMLLFFEYGLSAAAVAQGCASYLVAVVPAFDVFIGMKIGDTLVYPMAGVIIVFGMLVTALGSASSTLIQMIFVFLNFAVILAFVGFGAQYVDVSENMGDFFPNGFSGTLRAAAILFFSYIGFDAVTIMSNQARSKSHILWGMFLVIIGVTVLYLAVAFVLTGMQPWYELDVNTPLVTAFSKASGTTSDTIATLVGVSAFIVTCMTTISVLGATCRVLATMAQCSLAPAIFCQKPAADAHGQLTGENLINDEEKLTWTNLVSCTVACIVLAVFVSFDALIDAVTISTLLCYSLVALCSIIEAKKFWVGGKHNLPSPVSLSAALAKPSDAISETTAADESFSAVAPASPALDAKSARTSVTAAPLDATSNAALGDSPRDSAIAVMSGNAIVPATTTANGEVDKKEGVKLDLAIVLGLAWLFPNFFYTFQNWFGNSFWGGFTSVFGWFLCAAYLQWKLLGSNSFLPADRFTTWGFPCIPLVVLLVNGVMCGSMTFQGYWITFLSVIIAGLCWAVAKFVDFRSGVERVGIKSKYI